MYKVLQNEDYLWKIITVLSMVGILLAVYLYSNYLVAAQNTICSLSETVNCDAIITGNLAKLWSIPVSLIGLIGYGVIFVSSLIKHKKLSLFMTSFGMIFCLRLTILEIFFEHVYCPICLLCQLIMLTIRLISIKLYLQNDPISKTGL